MSYVASHHKALKRVGIAVLILFFCIVGVGIFLRTDIGLNFSLRIAQSLLEKQGMSLSYESVSGPLPTHLSFKRLRLTDQKGTWFTANTVTVDIKLLSLAHGTLEIPHVILDDAYMARTPESSSLEREETTSGSASLPVDVTIEDIEIHNVRVAQSLLFPPEITEEESSHQSGSTEEKNDSSTKNMPPPLTDGSDLMQEETKSLRADLSGKAGISDNKLVIALQGSVDLGNNEGVDIVLALDNGKKVKDFLDTIKGKAPTHFLNRESILPEELRLSFPDVPQGNVTSEQWFALQIRGAIVPEGNLTKTLHLPNNSGGAFLLHGIAPFSDWKGSLGFALIDSQRNIPLEGKGFLQLALTGNSSLFSRNKHLEAKTAVIARTGKGYASLPSALGKIGYITASAKGTTSSISTDITVETAPWKLSARDVSVTKKDAQTSLMGKYSLVIPRLDALTSSQVEILPSTPSLTAAEALSQEKPLDESLSKRAENSQKLSLSTYQEVSSLVTKQTLSSIALTQKNQWDALFLTKQTMTSNALTQKTDKESDQIPLFLSGTFSLVDQENIQAKSNGTLQTRINNTEHSLSYSLHANTQGDTAQLKTLTVDGLGISLHASGSAVIKDIANGNVSFDLLASGKENAPWQTLVNSLRYAEQTSSEQQFNGAFSLEAHATPDDAHGTKGTLQLTTSNMQWGTAQEQALLGSSPHVSMNFLGGGNLPWEAHIRECSTPFMSGTLDAFLLPYEQEEFTQNDKNSSPFARSKIQATAQMSLPNLTLLSSDLKGAVTVKALADGPLDNFITKVTVTSSSIEIPTGSITSILADLTSHISLPVTASTPFSIAGNLSAQAKDSYGGNFSIRSSWTAKEKSVEESTPQTETPLEIAVPEFLATGAGLRLSGKGSGIIDSSPHLTGNLTFSVTDWTHFSALTGIPLSGEKTDVSILLSPQPKQKITATLFSQALTTDDNSFSTTSLSGTMAINDLFGTPQPFASLSVGDGHIGQFDWEKGTIQISPQKEKNRDKASRDTPSQNKNRDTVIASPKTAIPISIVFSGKPLPARRLANKNQKNTHNFKPTDRLTLEALLYPENSSLELNSFGLYSPSAQAGLYLVKKSTLRFSPSLAVENLRMECVPKGSLTADVLFSPIKTSLDATLTDLPIERIGALAGAELPAGTLTMSASLHRQNNKVEGNLSIQGKLASSATQKESATLPFSMKAHLADLPDTSLFRLPAAQGVSHFIGKGTLSPHFVETKKSLLDNTLETTSQSNFAFDLPLTFTPSGIPLLATKQPFGFSLKFNGAIDPLWQVVSSPDRELTGRGDLNALYTGTFENPEGKLKASITNGQFEDHILGIFLTNIALHAKTENNAKETLNVRASLFATDGKKLKAKGLLDQKQEDGTIAIEAIIGKKSQIIGSSVARNLALRSGKESQKITEKERKQTSETKNTEKASIDWTKTSEKKTTADQEKTTQLFAQKNETTSQQSTQNNNRKQKYKYRPIVSLSDTRIADTDMAIALRGQIHNLEPLQRDDISLQLSGLLGVEGRLTSPHITGDFLVQRLEVLLELLSFGKSVTTLPIEQKNSATNIESDAISTADIHIGVPGRAFIRGFGLDSEWQGDAKITGKVSSPLLSGSLHTIGGDVELLSKPFKFAKGEIFFLGGVGSINPGIDMELVNRSSSLEAYIRVTGTASNPQFALASVPSLPKDEIVSQVLFSKRSSSLSRFEALQLADTLNDLFGESNKSLLSFSSVRKKIGIDVLRVNSGSTSEGRTLATSPNAEDTLTDSGQSDSDSEGVGNLSIEAGKYITDNVYVGVEQNMQDGTGVKVDIELTPRTSIQGSSTQTSSQVGIGWKMDY